MRTVRENMEYRLTTPFFEENNMIQNRFRRLAPLVFVMFAICIAPLTTHASWVVNVGTTIKFGDGPGSLAGEFNIKTNQSGSGGGNVTGNSYESRFNSFCVQTNEYINYSDVFTINNISFNSQLGGQALAARTSALYRTFMSGFEASASGVYAMIGSGADAATYDFGAGRAADADLLQKAIWFYQGQSVAVQTVTNNKFVKAVESLGFATDLAASALTGTNLTSYGGVRILNLVKGSSMITNPTAAESAQDQLYFGGAPVGSPEVPEPATMLLFGLGAYGVCCVRRRRI